MRVYKGINALSENRKVKLLNELQKIDKNITNIEAEYIHFASVSGKVSEKDEQVLKGLLTYDTEFTGSSVGEQVIIVPRPGTISPWSSKATEIAKNSGLKAVERIERGIAYYIKSSDNIDRKLVSQVLFDRMTEAVLSSEAEASVLFSETKPRQMLTIDILKLGREGLAKANKELGLALADDEIDYLVDAYKEIGRNPSDVELMMFGQINSEHCRHKVFNADWYINDEKQPKSLFKMIKNTYEKGGENVLSAYSDNAAVIKGETGGRFFADAKNNEYSAHKEPIHTVIKVETHNHPTAIAPWPGAATGSGGEIRDEGATGRGAKPKMGLAGYSVSNLNLPGEGQKWEKPYGKPGRIQSPLEIMIDAPLGASAFNNEFGRPNVAGYFRTYEQEANGTVWGYHKPIMIAGGLGNIREEHVQKHKLSVGSKLIVLGGPAMLIGLGGGAASSMQSGASSENLDFASVQRANAEMQRRVQQVIDTCWALGDENPIISIHDIGAGGLSNGLPELAHDSDLGAKVNLRAVPNAEASLSPLEIWCCEAQERYVLGLNEKDLPQFIAMCERERCPYAVVGETIAEDRFILHDELFGNNPIDIPMSTLFGKPPKMTRKFTPQKAKLKDINTTDIDIAEAVERVLKLPVVGSKKFLITIADRNVGGLVTQEQMVGPWQVPVSDVAVGAQAFDSQAGEAMAMGERTPLAVIDAAASARMAVAETITNIMAADIDKLSDVKLSANWMAAMGYEQQDENLFNAVKAVGEEFCPALNLTIPVGKDSLSMRTVWEEKSVTSPLSVIISGFSPVADVNKTLTPLLNTSEETSLILIDLGEGKNRLGVSALAQVFNQVGSIAPDAKPEILAKTFDAIKKLKSHNKILAYHDRSDGGLWATLCEMAFASRCGLDIDVSNLPGSALEKLFSEELGIVIQVKKSDEKQVLNEIEKAVGSAVYKIAKPTEKQQIKVKDEGGILYQNSRSQLESWWANTSYQIQKLRDNPECATQEYEQIKQDSNSGLAAKSTINITGKTYKNKPKVAIFREQGVNGQVEMAAAFYYAGFNSVDVHLKDILSGKVSLKDFVGLVACGGFSYGDVLGAGEGWAKLILNQPKLKKEFADFFARKDTFSLGVCNGCQMLSALKQLIPGADNWPRFLRNTSEQFEARLVTVQINESSSIFFKDMQGAILPVPVAHGEGRAVFASEADSKNAKIALQFTDNTKKTTEIYPSNPNGSKDGVTSLTSTDGRATIMMPHPERAFQTRQLSWAPKGWDEYSPWFKMFQNAREWVESQK